MALGWLVQEKALVALMLYHQLKLAFRNIRKNTVFSLINVFGLTVGLTSCIIISLYLYHEFSYDRWHPGHQQIYRVNKLTDEKGKQAQRNGITPGLLAPAALKEIPDIIAAGRFRPWFNDVLVSYDTVSLKLQDVAYADEAWLELFNFPLVRGDRHSALTEPFTAVITASAARSFFGNADPIGKTLITLNDIPVRVTGVARDIPSNSSMRFSLLISWPTVTSPANANYFFWMNNWTTQVDFTFVKLSQQTAAADVGRKLSDLLHRHMPEKEYSYTLYLQALDDIHLHSSDILYADVFHSTSGTIVYTLMAVAVFILLIACFNFIHLTTAGALARAKETGVQKVLGATRIQLIRQSFAESVLVCAISLLLSLVLARTLLPFFDRLTGSPLNFHLLPVWKSGLGLVALLIAVSALAGAYPALFLSRFRSTDVFRNIIRAGKDGWLRKSLVTTQFVLSILLIIATIAVRRQIIFMTTKDLGFDKEQLIVLPLANTDLEGKGSEFTKALQQCPGILSVTATNRVPGQSFNGYGIIPEGFRLDDHLLANVLETDTRFASTYGMQLTKGRFFSADLPTDTNNAIVINEAMARYLNWKDPVGKRFEVYEETKGKVVGVVKDFNFASLRESVQPLAFLLRNNPLYLSVRIRPGSAQATIAWLQTQWKRFDQRYPFDYFFLDQQMNRYYQSDSRLLRVLAIFAGIAISIACLGLFGISIYTTKQRTKEIGIRKVLGSNVADIIALLSGDMIRLVILACLISFPLAWWALDHWLRDFAYRVDLPLWIFLTPSVVIVLIAFATISFQAIKAALANPVISLRSE